MARPPKTTVPKPAEVTPPAETLSPQADPKPTTVAPVVGEGEVLVVTTGNFGLIDIITGREINPGVDNVVPDSPFIRERIELGHLELKS